MPWVGRPLNAKGSDDDVQRNVPLERLVLATVEELAQTGLLVVDQVGRVVVHNQWFATMWGVSNEDLLAGTDALRDAVAGRLLEPGAFLRKVEELRGHPSEPSHGELRLVDGRVVDCHSAPLWCGGVYCGRVWCFRDTTDARRAAEALQTTERRLQEALAAARMGTFEWNLDTDRMVFASGCEGLFGFAPGSVQWTREAFERCVSPRDLPSLRTRLARSVATGTPFAAEFRIEWPDGSEHWIAARGEFAFDAVGRPVRLRGMGVDITDRKRSDERIRRSMEQTVAALAAIVEARDPYTAGHQRQVAELAVAMARELGFDESRVHSVFLASILHDIGKVTIPTELLTSPRALNPVETMLLQTHVEAGYDILKGIDFPWPIAEFVRQHHERLDGSGYPRGLKGDEIALEARIIAVADTVQAVAAARPYRPALGIEAALAELETGRGKLFDELVVDACLALFRTKGFVFSDRSSWECDAGTASGPPVELPPHWARASGTSSRRTAA